MQDPVKLKKLIVDLVPRLTLSSTAGSSSLVDEDGGDRPAVDGAFHVFGCSYSA